MANPKIYNFAKIFYNELPIYSIPMLYYMLFSYLHFGHVWRLWTCASSNMRLRAYRQVPKRENSCRLARMPLSATSRFARVVRRTGCTSDMRGNELTRWFCSGVEEWIAPLPGGHWAASAAGKDIKESSQLNSSPIAESTQNYGNCNYLCCVV